MKRKPLLAILFAGLALYLPCAAAIRATQARNPVQAHAASTLQQSTASVVPRRPLRGSTGAPGGRLPDDGNLPEAASALPLLSAIGAGALLGGLLSARRTRPEK